MVGTDFMSCWPWGVFWWPTASLVHCVWWEQRGLSDETCGAHPLFDGKRHRVSLSVVDFLG